MVCGQIDGPTFRQINVYEVTSATSNGLQYDGSNDDLDWRIDQRYLNLICIMKYSRFKLVKGSSFE